MKSLRFGKIVDVNFPSGTFVIKEENRPNRFLSGRDCCSLIKDGNGNGLIFNERPKTLFKIKLKQCVVFQTDGDHFAVSWAPIGVYRAVEKSCEGNKRASARIGRRTFVGSPSKIRKLVRRLAPGGYTPVSVFTR